jgi:ubiquinone/menaquinone biosynthesis C-methylase UbiE
MKGLNDMNTQSEKTGYFVDPETAEEAERLRIQGRYLDKMMGLLPPQIPSLDTLHDGSLLDVGCSSGGWACDIASQYPHLRVTGIDISENMIRAARARAYANKLHERAHFDTMDARVYPLKFPDASFHVIHVRLIFAFIQPRQKTPVFETWG